MFGDSNQRRAHVKRVFQLNSDGSINTDVWIDLLRIDKVPMNFQTDLGGIEGQTVKYHLQWNDDPNNPSDRLDRSAADIQGENANRTTRETEKIKIKNPQSPEDPPTGLWIIHKMHMGMNTDRGGMPGQVVKFVFNNHSSSSETPPPSGSSANTRREETVMRVTNNDLAGMQMADSHGRNPRLVNWDVYATALQAGNKDADQYLDVSFTDKFWVNFATDQYTGTQGQTIELVLQGSRDIEGMFGRGNSRAVDANGNPSVVWTDPFQCVVNVFFGGAVFVVGDWGGSSGRIEGKSKLPLSLGKLAFTDKGQIYGGSYANIISVDDQGKKTGKPVFLMCGTDNRAPGTIDQVHAGKAKFGIGIIVASKDGKTWDTVVKLEAPVVPGLFGTFMNWVKVLGITWDGKNFYAGIHATIIFRLISILPDIVITSYTIDEHDILWSSPDGYSWKGIDQRTARTTKGERLPRQGLLCQYCSARVTDARGNNVPDGIYHHSSDSRGNEIFIRGDAVPTIKWDTGDLDVNVTATTLTIERTVVDIDGKKSTTKTTCSPGIPFLCLAFGGSAASGTIIVAGAEIAMSTDMGVTWTKNVTHVDRNGNIVIDGPLAYPGLTPPATTALGAPLSNLKKAP